MNKQIYQGNPKPKQTWVRQWEMGKGPSVLHNTEPCYRPSVQHRAARTLKTLLLWSLEMPFCTVKLAWRECQHGYVASSTELVHVMLVEGFCPAL